ncbi:DUF6680 family protein [Legionella spiritensis]|uniref:DUF6680 domain-containing protein n=1 Tax=Legionella spiritensis TaxID=452 RepID=A0A0W0Z8E3_LEGSP|nr:DUF6680 family protein [Legionella spiritensis]KTD65380.1 hypothetical protein Lspi_0697 [Legionella spiritensis]SNV47162.1 Uncharacterised protein [Legionella spiritensis]
MIDSSMKLNDILTIAAILIAPWAALFIQDKLSKWKEDRERRIEIFKTLMATRLSPLSFEHIRALNMIDIEFYGRKKYKRVRSAWRTYLDVRVDYAQIQNPIDAQTLHFDVECNRTLINLLVTMGESLGYDFDESHVKQSIYKPKGHFTEEQYQFFMRTKLVELFSGDASLPVSVVKASNIHAKSEHLHNGAEIQSPDTN